MPLFELGANEYKQAQIDKLDTKAYNSRKYAQNSKVIQRINKESLTTANRYNMSQIL